MVSYLYTFNLCTDSNRNCKYLEWITLTKSLDEGKSLEQWTIQFDFRLDIDGSSLSLVNKFIYVTDLTKQNEISEKLKSQSTQSKTLGKTEEIGARGFSRAFEKSGLKFSLLYIFHNLLFSLEILIFSCVVEFLEVAQHCFFQIFSCLWQIIGIF